MTPPRPAELPEPELLACPFCAGKAEFRKTPIDQDSDDELLQLECTGCPALLSAWLGHPEDKTYADNLAQGTDKLTNRWNTRARAPKAGAVAWQDDVMAVIAEMRSRTFYTNQFGQDAIRSWICQLETAIADEAPRPDWKYWYNAYELWMGRAKQLGWVPPGDETTPPTQPEVRALVEAVKAVLLHRVGAYPLNGELVDNDSSRADIDALAQALTDLEKAE